MLPQFSGAVQRVNDAFVRHNLPVFYEVRNAAICNEMENALDNVCYIYDPSFLCQESGVLSHSLPSSLMHGIVTIRCCDNVCKHAMRDVLSNYCKCTADFCFYFCSFFLYSEVCQCNRHSTYYNSCRHTITVLLSPLLVFLVCRTLAHTSPFCGHSAT